MAQQRRSISCPSCERTIALPASAGPGTQIACPHCGQRSLLQAVPPESPAAPGSHPHGTAGVPSPGDGQHAAWTAPAASGRVDLRSVMVGGLAALIVGGAAVGALYLAKSRAGGNAGGDPATGGQVATGNQDSAQDASIPEVATKAEAVLRPNCHRCHGDGGSNEGGFNFVLRRDKLIDGGLYVVPGKPAESRLLQRMQAGEMPPVGDGERVKPEDVAVVAAWIEAGAPEFTRAPLRDFISPEKMFDFARNDLTVRTAEPDRRFVRYFTLTHLYNAGLSDDEMETYRLALLKLLNSLSWSRELVLPQEGTPTAWLDPARTILRVDLRNLDWTDEVWRKVIKADPYALIHNVPSARQCQDATECQVPSVRGDWFVSAASQPPLYYDVLQIPDEKPMDELQRMLRVDTARNIERRTVARAGFNGSNVSRHNRLIERHRSPYGALWVSYDFASSVDRRNLLSHPMGPGTDEESFDHDGGEVIFNLPNGLQGYLLVDGKGNRLDKGPTTIVTDDRRPDRAVVNGLSCMSCHFAGIIRKDDAVRPHVLANRDAFPDAASILALYPEAAEMRRLQEEDAKRFEAAVTKVGLPRVSETGEPIVNMALRFESDLDLKLASAELGLTADRLVTLLGQHPDLARVLGTLKVPGGSVKRDVYVKIFTDAATAFGLGTAYNVKPDKIEVADGGAKPETPKAEPPQAENPKPEAPKPETPATPDPDGDGPPAKPLYSLLGTGIVRNWYDQRGRYLTHGELMGLQDGRIVVVKKDNGGTLEFDIDVFSDADQRIVLNKASEQTPLDLPAGEGGGASGGPAPPLPPRFRTWTPITGDRNPFEAQYVSTIGALVVLKRPNGDVVRGPLEGLSEEDQAFVEEMRARPKKSLIGPPPKPATTSQPPVTPAAPVPGSTPATPPADLPPPG